ncbi:MAG: response regulator transcription factor [Turicibacter sp.]|jgi:two-component system alkaline phosphatase synthesis response regulator PhoP|uniref:DNA-binding response regulator n=1 Tax=Turicibacter faecis TaxID=2963365 RepID=A0ABN6ZFH6_9FIRM|nr:MULTISPECIES: response regulator transcription factor [unclassified Turicibacter]MCI8702046.1 response regulator transcription factor [Turicibacter sp.]BEH91804.1 DNA-binding response regulator [Turicibacter sp. TC023]MCU7205140.1 response regulator transcription factor [Turicibacter sp. TA25]MCU7209838.1 response regulator transcription factor [Turicibacter sp. 1E2]NCE78920.1 DNA-binding response regulator [Turicibacter sp. TS3]
MGKRVLVVEDELSIQRILQYDLMQSGFIVDLASDGEEGLQKARRNSYDVMILDVMLPKRDGFSVCKELRKEENPVYIVMLSARDDEFDRVMGLDVGADDYMTKPFSSREVVSKVKAIMRRKGMHHQKACTERLSYQQLILDQRRFEVLINEEVIDFTLKEYELLEFLIHHQGQALSRNLLLDRLWGYEYDGDTRIVDVHIFKIREKLKPYGIKIKTIRGIGYMLEDEKND